MAKATTKTPTNVTIPQRWQLAFIAATAGAYLVTNLQIVWGMVRISRYVSSGTLAIQMSMWLYPLVYLLAAYLFVRPRIRGSVPRLFWAMLVAAIGTFVYDMVGAISQVVRQETRYTIQGNSIWDAFGYDWTLMAVMLVLYVATLWAIGSRGKRA